MPRSYQHISSYEKEILELKTQGLTLREIGTKFGFTEKQVHNFITQYNEKQRLRHTNVFVGADSDTDVRCYGKVIMGQRIVLPDYLFD